MYTYSAASRNKLPPPPPQIRAACTVTALHKVNTYEIDRLVRQKCFNTKSEAETASEPKKVGRSAVAGLPELARDRYQLSGAYSIQVYTINATQTTNRRNK
ncbi:hypothetical protein PHLCEN_2v11466 [Hermanssonia centrifuga]|uniref:Uncharacterized protein n=1 Tax=Hermanssonia centrifuga TaxID=98765 RepID=A0A2R6NK95_9APHY|nr:hypothetical protein PHLCEN_2v11466 [Hermanssonia centrifuga]